MTTTNLPPPDLTTPETWVVILYTNHRGFTTLRWIVPNMIWFAETEYHPEPQHLLEAWDLDKMAWRDFAMLGIQRWHQGKEFPLQFPIIKDRINDYLRQQQSGQSKVREIPEPNP